MCQSKARKYNRECKLANQRKVPVTMRQKSLVRWRRFVGKLLLACCCCKCCFVLLLFCFGFLSGPFKKENVWLIVLETINDSWKYRSTETLDKNKKTLILVFRCWHYKTNGQSLWKSFEAMNEMFISIVFVFKLSLSIIAVFTCSTVSYHRRSFLSESAFETNVFLSPKPHLFETAFQSHSY